MDTEPNSVFPYRFNGGSLNVEDSTYVRRQADQDFYEGLKAGQFCYVFNSRQMGKSSLRVRTKHRLQKEGFACVEIDLTLTVSVNEETTPQKWYRGIIRELVSGLQLQVKRNWWREHDELLPVHRFNVFIEEVLLAQVRQNIVIFVDEIDSILRLNFPVDDFFALIRACDKQRPAKPEYRRLTWALLGVATPYDLIQDKNSTPFDIGRAIELQGFQLNECTDLEKGFAQKARNPRRVLKEVLEWTGGQPFLTQKLCWIVATSEGYIARGGEAQWVKRLVRSRIIENWQSQDDPPHLKSIRDRILSGKRKGLLLELYQKILQRRKIPANESPEQMELRLSGLVVQKQGKLRVYNRICQLVFDQRWVEQALGKKGSVMNQNPAALLEIGQERRTQTERDHSISRLRPSFYPVLLASVVVTVLVIGARSVGLLQPLELKTFDRMLQLRPAEKRDERLLIVKVTQEDIDRLGDKFPLTDSMMLRLLKKLDEYNPQVVGLDIYRDRVEGQGRAELIQYMQQSKHIIPVCKYPDDKNSAIPPPPGISEKQVGFVDVVDDPDYITRRHLLSAKPLDSSRCPAEYALSTQLAYRYLKDKGKSLTFPTSDSWQFGSLRFKILNDHQGFYQQRSLTNGHQILLNYRVYKSLEDIADIAEQATLTQVISNQVKPNLIRGRIILIGVTDPTLYRDEHNTPYNLEIRGLWLHAQMVSQLISAVEDGRPLLWFLPLWGDAIWVWVWALAGGGLTWRLRSALHSSASLSQLFRVLTVCVFGITLSGISFLLLLENGLLVPLVPSALAVMTTGGIAAKFLVSSQRRKMNDE